MSTPEPEPGADTPLSITKRVTMLEFRVGINESVDIEQGKIVTWLSHQLLNPGDYGPERPRKI
jgi:hypothetical protein